MKRSVQRKSSRFPYYNYSRDGYYFVTICVKGHRRVFGEVVGEKMVLNEAGRMIAQVWQSMPDRFTNVTLDEYQMMPNHFHGIVIINNDDAGGVGTGLVPVLGQTTTRVVPTLSDVIGAFKSLTTNEYIKGVREKNWKAFHGNLWQRSFYDHVIRTDDSFHDIREYIVNNPLKWENDNYYI